MTLKIWIVLVLALIIGGGLIIVNVNDDPPKPKSDFFKNEVKDIDVRDGKQY